MNIRLAYFSLTSIVGILLCSTPSTAMAQFQMQPWLIVCGKTAPHDRQELRQMYVDDQAQRRGDKTVPPDSVRRTHVFALYHADSLQTAADFAFAALTLHHSGQGPQDFLLAHELSMVGTYLGCGGFNGVMGQLTEVRLLGAMGLDENFVAPTASPGFISRTKTESQSPQADPVVLTLPLVTQVLTVAKQLKAFQVQHPEVKWGGPPDSLAAIVARTPALATVFAQAKLSLSQYIAVREAYKDASVSVEMSGTREPLPLAPVTGALRLSNTREANRVFVRANYAVLAALHSLVPLQAEMSELAQISPRSVVLPPDTMAMAWLDPCPSVSDTLTDNRTLRQLTQSTTHPGNSASPVAFTATRIQILSLLRADSIRTPHDMLRAAIVLETSAQAEDALRAHNLALSALKACGAHAVYMAVASEDRFLALLGLKQRWGTLPRALVPLDTGPASVTPWVRHFLGITPQS